MDYRILGPLEVTDGCRPIGLGGEKQRALLAVLLLHAGEVVSSDRLIDDLWGERAPTAAHNALQVHVSRLRKALDGGAAGRPQHDEARGQAPPRGVLVTRGHGYVLRVEPGELDLDRFRAMVEDGREALARGDPLRAAESLGAGLALWRGPPLADFLYEPFAEGPIAELEELRLSAVQDRVDADLAIARHEQLIGELTTLVAQNPLRERLLGQLMLALYRCGRQPEALDVYQELRHRLAEQLGLDPSPGLQQLQAAILTRDLSLELDLSGGVDAGGDGGNAGVRTDPGAPVGEGRAGGFRTFLLGNIRAYSSFAAARGDEAAAALTERFVAVAERVVSEFGGANIGSRGDEVLIAFESPRQAVRAAVAFAQALLEATREDPSLPMPAGVGLDVGEAVIVSDGWRANAINVAARLCALARGGEILGTREVTHLAQAVDGIRYLPLPPVRLKGIPGPVAVIRIVADTGDPARGFAQLGLAHAATPPNHVADGGSGSASVLEVCPFKGLAFFDRADAEYFFGRERPVSDLLARLVESTVVGILGPSGIGKSSLLRAGVLPALTAGALPGSASWRQLLLRPGEYPCVELQRALDGELLARVLERLSPGERIVIAVDQLEELFTVCGLEEERAAFLKQLVTAARDGERRALVICALRADFYGRLASYPAFAELLSAAHVLVAPMGRDELARAIEQPAARAGLEVERALVDALVSDVAGEPGGLPLLSTTLLELWRTHDGGALRYERYRTSGGVRSAVARLAEATHAQLGDAEQQVARSMMLRLAGDQDGALVRRRVPHAELVRQDDVEPVLAALIDARLLTVTDGEVELAHEALLREWPRYRTWLEEDRAGRRLHAHLTSSAREWDTRGREAGDLYRGARLTSTLEWAAQHEHELNVPERQFLNASRHHAARATRRLHGALVGVGLLVVVASVAAAIALISRGQAVTAETTANAGRLAALSEIQLPVDPERAVLLAIAAVRERATYGPAGTMFALRAALDASTIRYQLPGAGDEGCGAFYAVFDPAPGSNLVTEGLCDGKVRFLNAHTGRLERVVTLGSPKYPAYMRGFTFAGRRAALVGFVGDRLVALNPTTGAVIRRGPAIPLASNGFGLVTPDYANAPLVGAFVRASPGEAGVFVVWNYRTGRAIWVHHTPLPTVDLNDFSFAGPGTLAITFQGDAGGPGLALYDYVDQRVLATRPGAQANIVQSADGRTLAVGLTNADGTGTVELVNAKTLVPEPGFRQPTFSQGPAFGLTFSLDGRLLAYGFQDGSAGVLDTSTGAAVNRYAGATQGLISSVSISPDDRLVITASGDGTARAERIGDLARRTFPRVGVPSQFLQLSPTAGGFEAIASPGPRPGEGIVVERYSDAGLVVGAPLVMSHQTGWLDASLSPDGTLATDALGPPSTQSAPLSEWSVPGRHIARTITFPNGPGGDPVISPTDRLLVISGPGPPQGFPTPGPPNSVTSTFYKPAVLIDLRTGRRRTLAAPTTPSPWQAFAFSRTGAAVAAGTVGGQVGVWDTVTGRRLGRLSQISGTATSLAFSPDGRSLAIGSSNGTVYVARAPLTYATRPLQAGTGSVPAVAYSPDGRFLASVELDGTARVYDARSLAELRVIQLPQAGQGVAFTTNSRDLLIWDATGTVSLWDACTDCENPSALVSLARTRVTRSLTSAERQEFGVR